MPNGNGEGAGGMQALAQLLPVVLLVMTALPGWATLILLVVGLMIGAGRFVTLIEATSAEQKSRQAQPNKEGATKPPGEVVELFGTGGLHLVAMRANWGNWPDEAAEALAGEAYLLPVKALADPAMDKAREAAAGRIAVVQRSQLRAMGVRSWLAVVRAVQSTGAKGLLIVNADEELVQLSLPPDSPGYAVKSSLPTAVLRKAQGEVLLAALAKAAQENEVFKLFVQGALQIARARADELSVAGRYGEAAELLLSGLKGAEGSEEVSLRILLADALRLSGRPAEAAEEAHKAVHINPESADGWVAVVQALRSAGQVQEALKAAEQAVGLYEVQDSRLSVLVSELSRSPEEVANEHKARGNDLFKEHRFQEARDAYTAALEALPTDGCDKLRAACLGNRAACGHQIHDWDNVITDASQALTLQPDSVKVRLRRALACEAVEKYKDALSDARIVLRAEPRHPQANAIQHRAGKALRELGIPDPALHTAAPAAPSSSSSSNSHMEKPEQRADNRSIPQEDPTRPELEQEDTPARPELEQEDTPARPELEQKDENTIRERCAWLEGQSADLQRQLEAALAENTALRPLAAPRIPAGSEAIHTGDRGEKIDTCRTTASNSSSSSSSLSGVNRSAGSSSRPTANNCTPADSTARSGCNSEACNAQVSSSQRFLVRETKQLEHIVALLHHAGIHNTSLSRTADTPSSNTENANRKQDLAQDGAVGKQVDGFVSPEPPDEAPETLSTEQRSTPNIVSSQAHGNMRHQLHGAMHRNQQMLRVVRGFSTRFQVRAGPLKSGS